MKQRNFYQQLEGLRGMAILLVLISHFLIIKHFPQFIFLELGAWGVNIFFVLSGFLITEILLSEIYDKKKPLTILKNFFAKRVLRIFPIYYLSVLILAICKVNNTQDILPYTLTYTYNIGTLWFNIDSGIFMHIWSLCVEEQFYILWPLALLIIPVLRHHYLILLLIFSAILLRLVFFIKVESYASAFNHSFTVCCFDALGAGALLAYLKLNQLEKLQKILNHIYVPVILVLLFFALNYWQGESSWFYQVLGRFFFSVTGFYLVGLGALSIQTYFGVILNFKWLKYLGKISYGVYLYHWILYFLLQEWFFTIWKEAELPGKLRYNPYVGSFFFFTTLTIAISVISFYCFERPILKLKKYFA